MKTSIEENELNAELQELYLKSKEKISDLEFIHTEILFIKSLFNKIVSTLIKRDDYNTLADLLIKVIKMETEISDLNSEVIRYRKTLEPLIFEVEPAIDLSLVQNYNNLDSLYRELLEKYHSLKARLFDLNKNAK